MPVQLYALPPNAERYGHTIRDVGKETGTRKHTTAKGVATVNVYPACCHGSAGGLVTTLSAKLVHLGVSTGNDGEICTVNDLLGFHRLQGPLSRSAPGPGHFISTFRTPCQSLCAALSAHRVTVRRREQQRMSGR
ncbi:hypothetical protein DL546_004798 [Coniochaeta pulveracea]|uniref:Uncharacterized protein n=1 Tax=Coniochaeta pulveracea TaxID=177199 RepID=A0A420Y6A3_9PEZI|nr:hypothetical protein DL546_004798 [Coniochaeta pulveracea]